MSEHRFGCTSCGRCCFGWLPLTVNEAFEHAGRFPLAITFNPVRQGDPSFKRAEQLGATLQLDRKQRLAILVMPVAYIPPTMACPELGADNLCMIYAQRPLRCATMPFYPYRLETCQAEMLAPREGWLCDTSLAAPIVYSDKKIIEKQAFTIELSALLEQAPRLRAYAETFLLHNPSLRSQLLAVVQQRLSGRIALDFSTFVRFERHDMTLFARQQSPVLETWITKTAHDPLLSAYTSFYQQSLDGLSFFLEASGT